MSLLPILTLLNVAKDATTITVVDGTGNYSGSNTGGFGSPNPLKVDVTGAILSLYTITDPDILVNYRLTSTTDLFAAGETVLAESFSGITTGTTFRDGVYGIKYNLLYSQTATIAFTEGSYAFTLTGASTIFATAVGFIFDGSSKIYYIDRTKTLNGTGGSVTEAFDSTGSETSFEISYESDLKLLIDKAGDRCLTEDIGIWAQLGCKDDNFKNIWVRFKQRIALRSKFSQGYLYDAQRLAVSLSSYCDCVNTLSLCC